jgi:hypothetical protein
MNERPECSGQLARPSEIVGSGGLDMFMVQPFLQPPMGILYRRWGVRGRFLDDSHAWNS